MTKEVVVVGGGITGLSAAYKLQLEKTRQNLPLKITILEGSNCLGGVIRSEARQDFIVEHGPDSFLVDEPATQLWCRQLDLESQLVQTNSHGEGAQVCLNGKLYGLPKGFVMIAPSRCLPFLTSSLFSPAGKLRALMDLVIPAKHWAAGIDESVETFVKRRLGKEILERAAQPLVGGIYTADVSHLSARATIAKFIAMEMKHGSVLRGLWSQSDNGNDTASGARYKLFVSPQTGMQQLIEVLKNKLRCESIELGSDVRTINRIDGDRWLVVDNRERSFKADGVIIATPTNSAANLLTQISPSLSADLRSLKSASAAVVNLLFRKKDITYNVNSFGFVVPPSEKREILAASFISNKFSFRAPADAVMLRIFIGGTLGPTLVDLSEAELISLALANVSPYLKPIAQPIDSWVTKWHNSMPQYGLNHEDHVNKICSRLKDLNGLVLAGNSYRGVGIPQCIKSGEQAASDILASLKAVCVNN